MGRIRLTGATSGYTELRAANAAGNNTITLPTTTGGEVIVSDSSGNVNIDSGTFYIDASNNRVGIGTTSPQETLHLSGTGWVRTQYGSTISSTAYNAYLGIQGNNYGAMAAGDMSVLTGTSGQNIVLMADSATGTIRFASGGSTERARIDSSGRLLVGTSTSRATASGGAINFVLEAAGTYTQAVFATNQNNSNGAYATFAKSRGSSANSFAAVQSSDEIGIITFEGADGTNSIPAARIAAYVDGTPGTNDMPGRLVFSTTADGASSPTERVRIDSYGTLKTASTNHAMLISTTQASGLGYYLLSGRYGASAGSPGSGTASIDIYSNGDVRNTNNSYGAISDVKLKENIVDANSQWDDLKALQVRNYNFKEGQTHAQIGLIAQEVELVSPGLVSESPDRDAEGNDLGTTTKSVNYSVLYMKAVKALQEAMERIEQLETEMAAVKAQLS